MRPTDLSQEYNGSVDVHGPLPGWMLWSVCEPCASDHVGDKVAQSPWIQTLWVRSFLMDCECELPTEVEVAIVQHEKPTLVLEPRREGEADLAEGSLC